MKNSKIAIMGGGNLGVAITEGINQKQIYFTTKHYCHPKKCGCT